MNKPSSLSATNIDRPSSKFSLSSTKLSPEQALNSVNLLRRPLTTDLMSVWYQWIFASDQLLEIHDLIRFRFSSPESWKFMSFCTDFDYLDVLQNWSGAKFFNREAYCRIRYRYFRRWSLSISYAPQKNLTRQKLDPLSWIAAIFIVRRINILVDLCMLQVFEYASLKISQRCTKI